MIFDSLVIGSGPAGFSAALYLARFGLSVALIEGHSAGGLLLQTAEIENYPGFAKAVKGYELADAMEAQLAPYDNITRISGTVKKIEILNKVKKISLEDKVIEVSAVIIASGVTYRKLGLEGEGKYLGRGISYCALCDGQFFKNKTVGVLGGGNSALEESLYLSRLVSNLHLIHRRDEFRGDQYNVRRLKEAGNVSLELSEIVTALHGNEFLESVTVKNVKSGKERQIPMDGLFVYIGFLPKTSFIPEGLELSPKGFIKTDSEMRTNLPGIFAAGDVRDKLCRQVATAVGDGVNAANSAYLYLEQEHA